MTGRAGKAHVTSQQARMQNQGVWGDGTYILPTGQKLEPEVQSANEIRIRDGAVMCQGAMGCVKVNTYDTVTIQNGTQGMKRIDLIVWRYTYDEEQDVEAADWAVIQGTPAETDPVIPGYTEGSIQEGDTVAEFPIFSVELDGINVTNVNVLAKVAKKLDELNNKNSAHVFENRFETGYIIRIGNVKRLSLANSTVNFKAGETYTLGTLDSEYRPVTTAVRKFIAIAGNESVTYFGRLAITTDGVVTFTPYVDRGVGTVININETYI